jgi:hypothetical protein
MGHDEVYIVYNVDPGRDKRFPDKGEHDMTNGDVWFMDLPISFQETVTIELFDHDTIGTDSLGSHTYFSGDPQPDEVIVHGHDDSVYILYTYPLD